jgi:hypothetical protein
VTYLAATLGLLLGALIQSPLFWLAVSAVLVVLWRRERAK